MILLASEFIHKGISHTIAVYVTGGKKIQEGRYRNRAKDPHSSKEIFAVPALW